MLGEAVSLVGGPQIRNIGTIGGNTCNGVTSADSASTLFAWDAVVELTGPEGIRKLPIQELRMLQISWRIMVWNESRASKNGWHGSTTFWTMPTETLHNGHSSNCMRVAKSEIL